MPGTPINPARAPKNTSPRRSSVKYLRDQRTASAIARRPCVVASSLRHDRHEPSVGQPVRSEWCDARVPARRQRATGEKNGPYISKLPVNAARAIRRLVAGALVRQHAERRAGGGARRWATASSDIHDHLGTLFYEAVSVRPRLIVELGTPRRRLDPRAARGRRDRRCPGAVGRHRGLHARSTFRRGCARDGPSCAPTTSPSRATVCGFLRGTRPAAERRGDPDRHFACLRPHARRARRLDSAPGARPA